MKRILSILIILAFGLNAHAQLPPVQRTPWTTNLYLANIDAMGQTLTNIGNIFTTNASVHLNTVRIARSVTNRVGYLEVTNLTTSAIDSIVTNRVGYAEITNRLTLSSGNIALGANWVSSDGDSEGINVDANGRVGINTIPQVNTSLAIGDSNPTPLVIYRSTAGTGGIQFGMQKLNSVGTTVTFAQWGMNPTDDVSTTEDADIFFNLRENGALAEKFRFRGNSRLGVGVTSPTAGVHIKAGTTAAATAPLKFSSGTSMTTPEAGAMEYDGTQLYFSPGSVRYNVGLTRAPFTAYSAGTVYALTATPALLDFGTTDPSITITTPGTYLIRARVRADYAAATFAASQEVTFKLRRTNNTAADLTNASAGFATMITTTVTYTADNVSFETVYTTANSNDVIELWGSVAATPGAGALNATAASIVAIRLY